MDASRRPRPADPDFDSSTAAPVRLRDFDPLEHQRLVVNPLLSIFGLVVLWHLSSWFFSASYELLGIAVILLLFPLPMLVQYHCLDCGRTGRFSRRARHSCHDVFARWHEDRPSRFPFPSTHAQVVVWGWVIISASMLLFVLSLE